MTTQDVGLGDSSSVPLLTRLEASKPILDEANWENIKEEFDVVIRPFQTGEEVNKTNLFEAIKSAREDNPTLRAIVLASDGDWNDGSPPVQAAMQLRLEQIPIFPVPLGSQSRLPDLDLLSFDVPTYGVSGKNVRIPFTIESSLPRDHVAQVELKISDGTKISHQVRVAAMGRTSDAILWKPENTGDYMLTMEVAEHPEERLTENNVKETPIVVREEKLRVLVVETFPRWEYRYLRNALSRDPGVEVSCLLFHPGLSKRGGGSTDYIKEFPDQLEDLAQYDVVFLGDVGIEEGQLTEEQCRLLKDWSNNKRVAWCSCQVTKAT